MTPTKPSESRTAESIAEEIESRTFLEHKGMAIIKKEKLIALYAIYHTVEFYVKYEKGYVLPKPLEEIFSDNLKVMQQ